MAIIPMSKRRAQAVALRLEDRVPHSAGNAASEQPIGVLALLVATAIVAGSVVGLMAYDAQRPLAMGAVNAPVQSLPIFVEPSQQGGSR